MDLIPSIVNAAVVSAVGVLLWLLIRARLEALDDRFQRLEDRVGRLESSVNGRVDALRSDLTQVALAVGAKPRSESG